jgi:Flp pilus assembly protein TadG
MGFVAMAVDIGMIAVARTQVQHIADAAAFTAARSLNGGPNPDLTTPINNAQTVARNNKVLSDLVQNTDVAVQLGAYHYDSVNQTFLPDIPTQPPDSTNLAQVTVTHQHPSAFAAVLGVPNLTVSATAIGAHRPMDINIILDYSGSMNNESDLWNIESYVGSTYYNTSNNSDPVFPQFGPYSPTFSPQAAMQQTSTDPIVGKCNVSQPVLGVWAMVNDYYQNSRGSSLVPAFNPAPPTVTSTQPGGDNYLFKQNTTTPALTWQDITGSSSTPFTGYPNFVGWTQGPNYWGKTFYIWPPDPNPAKDWRKKFFLMPGGSYPTFGGPITNNLKLWDASGNWLGSPAGNYVINYRAILAWIQANCIQSSTSDPKPFPPLLRAGRLIFYDAIPNDVPAAAYDHTQTNTSIAWADQNQRFWKEYIDYVIGVWRDPYGNIQNPPKPACSMGGDFTPGSSTPKISGPDSPTPPSTTPWINPTDNPKRPRHRFWFGPMTMIQFLSDTGLFPGTARDISMSVAKLGIDGGLRDIQNNHPNDLVSMILFSRPQDSNDPPGTGTYNNANFALSRDYTGMINALWYPPNSGVSDVRPWDANGLLTPRAHADYNANTATSFGFMLAYNQYSSNPNLRTILYGGQPVGGLGRIGAQRTIILETDGMANVNSTPANGFYNGGANNSYYHILPGDLVNSGGYTDTELLQVVQALCNKADGTPGNSYTSTVPNPGYPGYSTDSKPVQIYTLAFGAIFEPTASGTEASRAVTLLQEISAIGGTIFPSSSTDPDNGYKWCIGTLDQRKAKLQQALHKIMDTGTSISLVK